MGDARRTVDRAQVTARGAVDVEVLHLGHWFTLGSLWRMDGQRVWGAVARSDRSVEALLVTPNGADIAAIAALPGAEVLSGRGDMGGITFRVPVADLADVRERVTRRPVR